MKISKIQLTTPQHWAGLTKTNHLHVSSLFQKNQKASEKVIPLLAMNYGKFNGKFVNSLPVKEFDRDDAYDWDIIGSNRRNIPLVEARDTDGAVITAGDTNKMYGSGTAPFYLVFAEEWFMDGEVIHGMLNEIYPMRILGDAKAEGSNYVYEVELMGGNMNGIPGERLQAGERFSVEYAPVEKAFSRGVGGVRHSTYMTLRNEWSTVRIKDKVPGNFATNNSILAFALPVRTKEGTIKEVTSWMQYEDFEVNMQFCEYKTNAMNHGRSNRNENGEYTNFGKSGHAIVTGAGLYEQLQSSNTIYYNNFNIKLIEDALYELSNSKLGFGEREFVLRTGERGAKLFNDAARSMMSGWAALSMNEPPRMKKVASEYNQNAVSVNDYQVVEWRSPMGIVLKLDIDPAYDDKVRHKLIHPLGGPAFSYRFDIMYVGSTDQPNIFRCKIKGKDDIHGYYWGMRNPFTKAVVNPSMGTDEDACELHKMSTFGICVLDPTRAISIIPNILAS